MTRWQSSFTLLPRCSICWRIRFQTLSYAKRCAEACQRLVHERLYDAACFFTSNVKDGTKGKYAEPNDELGIRNFAISPGARAASFARLKNPDA
ncbi:MAG: PaeR7I family type II restriction endonuclease [Thiobacillus sp.]